MKALPPDQTVILVAEDEVTVRNLVATMLTREGYAILTAADGREALQIFQRFEDAIHLLLTDVEMPEIDGIALADQVRKIRPDTKIIVMSGYTRAEILENNRPDAFLQKPFIPPTLLKCVQRVLAESFKGICQSIE